MFRHRYERVSQQGSSSEDEYDGELSEPRLISRSRVEFGAARRRRERRALMDKQMVALSEMVATLQRSESVVLARLQQLEKQWEHNRRPLHDALEKLGKIKWELVAELQDVDAEYFSTLPWKPAEGIDNLYGSTSLEMAMSLVIALNAILMGVELDYDDWAGWPYVDTLFLFVYLFELSIKLRHCGVSFFFDRTNLVWNYLDAIIVAIGIVDSWLVPLVGWCQALPRRQVDSEGMSGQRSLLSLLRLLRMFRLMRLVKVIKAIKPLYRQVQGISRSLMSMQWVMVLTLLALYAGAILWTTLMGKGLIRSGTDEEEDGEVTAAFGDVRSSLFSLFRIMNGDDEFITGVFLTVPGQLMFVMFMVIANWFGLAILTSVISNNMMDSSREILEEEMGELEAVQHLIRERRLKAVFGEIDTDRCGSISTDEWRHMLEDDGLLHELCDASGLDRKKATEIFNYLTVERGVVASFDKRRAAGAELWSGRLRNEEGPVLEYRCFIDHVRHDAKIADKRAVYYLLSHLRDLERRFERRFDEIWMAVQIRSSGRFPGKGSPSSHYPSMLGLSPQSKGSPPSHYPSMPGPPPHPANMVIPPSERVPSLSLPPPGAFPGHANPSLRDTPRVGQPWLGLGNPSQGHAPSVGQPWLEPFLGAGTPSPAAFPLLNALANSPVGLASPMSLALPPHGLA